MIAGIVVAVTIVAIIIACRSRISRARMARQMLKTKLQPQPGKRIR
jgi:hypothetical protein